MYIFMKQICLDYECILAPVKVKCKQSKSSWTVHIVLYIPDIYSLCYIFTISSTPDGISSSTSIS